MALKSVSLLILISLIGFMVSVSVSMHIHILPDGRIIVHSHTTERTDTNDSGQSNHSHTGKEFTLVHSLTHIFDKLIIVTILVLILIAIILFLHTFNSIYYSNIYHSSYPNRAPPPLSC